MSVFVGLEPAGVWDRFADLTRIARPPKEEALVRDHVLGWAAGRGFETAVDDEGNVVVRVPGGGCNQIVTINKSAWFYSDTVTPINTPTDCVLWNPWKESAAKMTGFDDTEYLYMAVIGPGRVSENQLLASGMYYKLNQVIMVSKDV